MGQFSDTKGPQIYRGAFGAQLAPSTCLASLQYLERKTPMVHLFLLVPLAQTSFSDPLLNGGKVILRHQPRCLRRKQWRPPTRTHNDCPVTCLHEMKCLQPVTDFTGTRANSQSASRSMNTKTAQAGDEACSL